ncbi:Uncharacterized protein TPAR_08246 [Tolypocladium paradoxum]|uniref:Uncharacterized protein n=1 Tax=Tolypocladium paradoxum TaxID=94208 RepID=A0A2S4KN34_9HYPO|nr:Uncharacterized protein TPAR_08246 [Tolypocladium paradoxum]
MFGSKLEHKARDPAACDSIGYDMRPQGPAAGFVGRFFLFFVYCFFLSLCHRKLERVGLHCRTGSPSRPLHDGAQNEDKNVSLAMLWAETLVTTGVCFLLAQGYYGVRAARERMERVRQTIITLAYSFIKTTTTDSGIGHGRQELQVLIYECLALLTAYPVALLEQMRGNTCEPAITRYCQDTSRALKRLRDGDDSVVASQFYRSEPWVIRGRGHHQFATIECFFEVFALQLQLEFTRQTMRTKGPSMTSQHLIYNLRNHFENFVDLGNLDDRRTPIIRENIDMLALAGRECGIFSFLDVAPIAFLWSVHLAGWLIAVYCPVQNCDWLVAWTPEEVEDSASLEFPSLSIMMVMAVLSVLSAMLTTILSEMWKMWDPFGAGTNTHAWTLGIASEIDNMLNEFYEYDTKGLIRKHAYMDPSAYLNDMGCGAGGSSGNRAQTV